MRLPISLTLLGALLTASTFAQEPPAPPETPIVVAPAASLDRPSAAAAPAVTAPAAVNAAGPSAGGQPAVAVPSSTSVRLKDVASIQGEASMPLIGYGLVVGLNKTGDKKQTIFPAQTLATMLERFGQSVQPTALKVENIAAVMVTAQLGPYAQGGARVDVTVASVGDAKSLQGGVLMPTDLRGPDGSSVALAQGPLTLGGYGAGGGGNSVQVNHLTVGRVPGGGLVEITRSNGMAPADVVRLALHEPDFVSARRVAAALNQELGAGSAKVLDAGAVAIQVPTQYRSEIPELIARIEPLPIDLDVAAKVVINERTGTVVLGGDVRIGPAAVAHGRLSVRIATRYEVSQPAPFSGAGAKTEVVPQTDVNVQENQAQMVNLEPGATLTDVVRALNVLGATPRDIITIMMSLKAAGALRAEVVVL
jgi:flagellar P-ring protein precursor FlgI